MFKTELLESRIIEIFPDGRLDGKNASRYLGLSEKTLATLRMNGKGPSFIKRGRIFYFKEDLDAWLNAGGRLTTTAQGLRSSSSSISESSNCR